MDFIHTFSLGDIELTIIGEGTLYGDPALVFKDMDETIWRNLVKLDEVGRLVFSLNLVLVRTQNRLVLLDTGIGEANKARQSFEVLFPFKDQLLLLDALNVLNINRMDITDVIFSHVHGLRYFR